MINIAAFDETAVLSPAQGEGGLFTWQDGYCWDREGLLVPTMYQGAPGWYSLTQRMREERSETFIADLKREKPKAKPSRPYVPRYTTDYAVKWGRRQGWKLVDRERYDYRTKRHHDLEMGVDAMFEAPGIPGRIGVQGAGKSERAEHYRRFMQRGGPEKAAQRVVKVVYVEFVRDSHEPVLEEWWA